MKSSEIPVPRRLYHWVNLISIMALTISGLYIHNPFAPGLMGAMRNVHLIFMWVFSVNLILRLYYAFAGKTGDWKTFLKPDLKQGAVSANLRHYLTYKPLPEGTPRVVQNITYIGLVLLFFLQITTGFTLYYAENASTESLRASLGGLAMVRKIHLFLMWTFLTFVVIHLYMSFSEELAKVKLMLFGVADEK